MVDITKSRALSIFHWFVRQGAPLLLIAGSSFGQTPGPEPGPAVVSDSRVDRLGQYFRVRKSPLDKFAAHFVEVADRYRLDWRLLPSLAMLESGGGRVYARNNIFGWASGRARFISVEASIDHVAKVLADGVAYRNKDLRAKLRTYNPANRRYADIVFRLFRDISPEAPMLSPAAIAAGTN